MPFNSSRSLKATSLVPSSDVPSGASTWMIHSPMSSLGTNSRPTIRFNGNVKRAVTTDRPMMRPG